MIEPVSLTSMISTVGFPIVAFLLMYRMATQSLKDNTEAMHQLKVEMQRMRTERGQ